MRLDGLSRELATLDQNLGIDLAVLEVHGARSIATPEECGGRLCTMLLGLRSRDALRPDELDGDFGGPDWDFEFGHGSYFVSVFAPFYPPDHSRWSGEPDVAFFLFQPEQGFRRFGISSQRPGRSRLSERVHRRFKARDVHYDLALNRFGAKALRYVKPLKPGDPPVRWWTGLND